MFRRLLLANRGEVAVRVLRTCRALGIQAVAVASPADKDLRWLQEADEVVALMHDGPVPRTCHFSGDDQSLVVQYGTDAEVWALAGPDPRRLIVAPARRPAGRP